MVKISLSQFRIVVHINGFYCWKGFRFHWNHIFRQTCRYISVNVFNHTFLKINTDGLIFREKIEFEDTATLCEKRPNREFFLVRIFLYLNGIWRFTEYISVFSPNTRKYGPEKTPYLDTIHAVFAYLFRYHGVKFSYLLPSCSHEAFYILFLLSECLMIMMMVMMMMRWWWWWMIMNCFCDMVDRRKAFSLIPSRDHAAIL